MTRRRLAFLALGAAVVFAVDAILVASRASLVVRPDRAISADAARLAHEHAWVVSVAKVLSRIGSPTSVDIAFAALAVVLLVLRRFRAAIAVVAARLVGLGAGNLMKAVVDRPRPTTIPALAHAGGSSFPSGHSSGAAGFAVTMSVVLIVVVGARRWVAPVVAVLAVVAVAVAVSRVLLVVHYPSDVVGGLALGVACAAAVIAIAGLDTQQSNALRPPR